jgi:hypothetical protein
VLGVKPACRSFKQYNHSGFQVAVSVNDSLAHVLPVEAQGADVIHRSQLLCQRQRCRSSRSTGGVSRCSSGRAIHEPPSSTVHVAAEAADGSVAEWRREA